MIKMSILRAELFDLLKIDYINFTIQEYFSFREQHNLVYPEVNRLLVSFPGGRSQIPQLTELINTINTT